MKKIKICVATTTRADFGLLKPLIREINSRAEFDLSLIATGSHLLKAHGKTISEIRNSGLKIDKKYRIFRRDSEINQTTNAASKMLKKTANYLSKLRPDYLILLGDRYETLAAATASSLLGVPIIHIAGGEKTIGSLDDNFRHAITKLSSLHMCTAEDYKRRIIQLGELPGTVYNVGSLALDNFQNECLPSSNQLASRIGFDVDKHKFALCTLHPETPIQIAPEVFTAPLLEALSHLRDFMIIFTRSNADSGGSEIWQQIREFAQGNANVILVDNLGQEAYHSLLLKSKFVIGNSSSGIYEAPSAGIPTINIGQRQEGRLRAASVIDCENSTVEISRAIRQAISTEFANLCRGVSSPFGTPGAARRITDIILATDMRKIMNKEFQDIKGD